MRFGLFSESARRPRKDRGEISTAATVPSAQTSETWLAVVPLPAPRYRTDERRRNGHTRPPRFRYAASLLRFASHRRNSPSLPRTRPSPYTTAPGTRFRVRSHGPSTWTPSHCVDRTGIGSATAQTVLMVSEPRTYGFGFFLAAGFLARGRGAGFGATFARLSRMRAESTPVAARARFAAANSGCPSWSLATARL